MDPTPPKTSTSKYPCDLCDSQVQPIPPCKNYLYGFCPEGPKCSKSHFKLKTIPFPNLYNTVIKHRHPWITSNLTLNIEHDWWTFSNKMHMPSLRSKIRGYKVIGNYLSDLFTLYFNSDHQLEWNKRIDRIKLIQKLSKFIHISQVFI